ncbi:hypothetical protein LRS73_20535 [Methylobacterium currus]|uniref:hypothetical protein n=1 Tax=Methylobacterium currus TaxID=2051553 RepID=UPI001E618467|nr:hypothetical protein [Methylobacterium currus]UHC14904.1 hypothetical protein LRS73_20535 [Methylobacterium currus]
MLRDEDLCIIARADYGWQADEHLAALRHLVHDRELDLGAWVPSEVLELTRWSRPADGPDRVQGPRRRASACMVLLRAICRKENGGYLTGIEDTLIHLVDSLSALDRATP